jgi:cytochrome c peroxidase
MRPRPAPLLILPFALALSACSQSPEKAPPAPLEPAAATATAQYKEKVAPPAEAWRPAPVREGGALSRGARDEALYLADEDHAVVRILPLPVGERPAMEVSVPGAPAQVLALDGRVLVSIRDPGLLLLMRPDPVRGLVEEARVPLPPDAWGIAVTPEETTAIVSSAWSNKLSAVDLDAAEKRWTVEVAREPRAIVVRPDGKSAYVTHLVGAGLTHIEGLDREPVLHRVTLPPAPASAPMQGHPDAFPLDASLAYAAVLSPAGDRLFVARHALGAYGRSTWFGRPTVDVLVTADASPLLGPRSHAGLIHDAKPYFYPDPTISADGHVPLTVTPPFTQPRAIAYRRGTKTLLVAGEGYDRLAELDARSLDPALKAIRVYDLGGPRHRDKPGDTRCGAPSGLALSADESQAYVFCRSTGDLAIVALDPLRQGPGAPQPSPLSATSAEPLARIVHLADDPQPPEIALGRRLFYSADDDVMSQGLGCAGCHPEGREDGHVWHEQRGDASGLTAGPIQDHFLTTLKPGRRVGFPRQTPMLVSRVAAAGPYGWHGDARTLEQRILFGFGLHRWGGDPQWIELNRAIPRAKALAAFLREGLVAPPREARALTADEERGRAIFLASETQCSTCHFPGSDYTDRSVVKLKTLPAPPPFADEGNRPAFKTPSLLYVGRTAPYFHDGRAATLSELIDQNHDRMGLTDALPREERAALVAFLQTIGTVSGEAAPPEARPAVGRSKAQAAPKGRPEVSTEPGMLRAFDDGSAIFGASPGAEASPRPTRAEWESASEVELPWQARSCRLTRVREWLRVQCKIDIEGQPLAQVTLITGEKDGVSLSESKEGAEMVFPVRRGDRRLLEVDRLVEAHKSWLVYDGTIVVSEVWLPFAPAPEIAVTREPHRPKASTP